VKEVLSRFGIEPSPARPEDFAALIVADLDRWRRVARSVGVSEN
jgi:tripartite-type tricarboxylate transporter receptor subunit TctC